MLRILAVSISLLLLGCEVEERECLREEIHMHLQPMWFGNTMMLIPMNTTVCVEYKEKENGE